MPAFQKLLFAAAALGAGMLATPVSAQTATPFLEAGLVGGAQQRILHSGSNAAINTYIANAVHMDVGTGLIPSAQPSLTLTAASNWSTSSTSLTFNSSSGCSGINSGAAVLTPGLSGMGSTNQTLSYVSSCTGSANPYTLTLSGYPYRSGSTGQVLQVTTGIAPVDSCHMVFSGWMRGNYAAYNSLTGNYFKDTYGGIRAPSGASAEQTYGLDLASDANGIRINMNNSAVLAGASTFNTLQETINQASIPTYFNNNQWNHILISANTCDWSGAVGSSPAKSLGSSSSNQYEEVYFNGVQVIGAATTNNWSANGINFSSPASGFSLNMGSPGDGAAVNDWADVELWTSIDLICGAPSTSASHCTSGNTISAHDLANFIDAKGHPVNPSARVTAYGGQPTAKFTGAAASFVNNAGTGATTAAYAPPFGGIKDVSSSPSWTSAANPSGQPPGTIGFKWVCSNGASTSQPYGNMPACGNQYSVGDLLIATYVVNWSSAPTSLPTGCTFPAGWTQAGYGYTQYGTYVVICTATMVVTSPGTADFTSTSWGVTGSSGGTVKGALALLLDYAESSIGSAGPPSVDAVAISPDASGTEITAPNITPCATCTNDLVISLFMQDSETKPPYYCPSAMTKRFDVFQVGSSSQPELFACEMQLHSNAATSGLTMAQPMGDGPEAFALTIAIHAN